MIHKIDGDLSIVIAGEAGQGIQSIEAVITSLLKKAGYFVFTAKEYMSRVRGGVNSIEIRVASRPSHAFLNRIDILIPLNKDSIPHLSSRITKNTIIIGEQAVIDTPGLIDISFSEIARDIGNPILANTIAAGVLAGLLLLDWHICEKHILDFFSSKTDDVRQQNVEALKKGYESGSKLSAEIKIKIDPSPSVSNEMLLTGSDAIALGALAGGCNYVCAYPMSPSTSVLEKMAALSKKFDIIVEQVEDEIGVINMALGAWYAGGRALVTTSGGGFALMSEGLSLAGMAEIPIVIHLAQRPGPATGLPTRTEQGDLFLALFAGHGEFPRIILAPGTIEEGYDCALKAFDLADKFQVPVIILTDQYFVDSFYSIPPLTISDTPVQGNIIKTTDEYKRYQLTKDGISPRGIPGWGTGCVAIDSDEHDETGHITEKEEVRNSMVEKRLRKADSIKKTSPLPEILGPTKGKIAVIGWGSTKKIITEALSKISSTGISQIHFSHLFPFPSGVRKMLEQFDTVILIENNATGLLGKLIKMETGFDIEKKILKYSGLPFSVEEVTDKIKEMLTSNGVSL